VAISKLAIDDKRNIDCDKIARNYDDGITFLKEKVWDILFLDNDLGQVKKNGKEKSGYKVLCWLEENPQYLPKQIILVTQNPVEKIRMSKLIDKLYGG
jgi:hypothetical protein